ncbi:CPCC family cysteine-rich protein [Pseudomonas sp. L7]|uniref:CPCC family cysteine-rich protein n=1 Tax=Pseudomonas TaxID=286 RepID=UPI003984ED46
MVCPCPCCEYLTFDERPTGTFEVCPVCGWEDDDAQFRDPTYGGGANSISLEQARINFVTIGAIGKNFLNSVREPFVDEISD